MELFVFFICVWMFIAVFLFIWTRHPMPGERLRDHIFSIILIAGVLAIAVMIILFFACIFLLTTLALFGVIG